MPTRQVKPPLVMRGFSFVSLAAIKMVYCIRTTRQIPPAFSAARQKNLLWPCFPGNREQGQDLAHLGIVDGFLQYIGARLDVLDRLGKGHTVSVWYSAHPIIALPSSEIHQLNLSYTRSMKTRNQYFAEFITEGGAGNPVWPEIHFECLGSGEHYVFSDLIV